MAIFRETKIKTSILVTLTLLFLMIGALPLVFSNWKLISINRSALETSLRENFVLTSTSVSSQISNFLNEAGSQILEYVPKAQEHLRSKRDASEPPTFMNQPQILKVRILDEKGKGAYFSKLNFQDPTIADLESQIFSSAVQGEFFIGNPYYSEVDNLLVLPIGAPVRDASDQVVGVLSVILRLDPLWNIIKDQSLGGKVVYVVDSQGTLIIHPHKEQMQLHKNLSEAAIVNDFLKSGGRVSSVSTYKETVEGHTVEILGSFSTVDRVGWGVIIQIEKNIALASIQSMIRESVKWGIVFAVAAALLGIFLARWITRPIQVLAEHALDIGRNQNFDRKIELSASNEIQQLADTLNFMTDEIKQYVLSLQAAVRENKELFMNSISMLAAAIDAKDPYTRGHSERVKDYAMVIARQMSFNAMELERLEIAALLHDVGKIGIDDRILRKPTNLTPEEFEVMKTHPDKGANILSQIQQLADIVPGTRAHHENYDGSGYPQGMKGEEIPIFARVITVADTFDAMTTDRPYQKAFTLEFAMNRIRTMSGIKYDPVVVEAFTRACEDGKVTLHKPSRPKARQPVPS